MIIGVLCDRNASKRQLCLLIGNDVLLRTAAEVAVAVASVDERTMKSWIGAVSQCSVRRREQQHTLSNSNIDGINGVVIIVIVLSSS